MQITTIGLDLAKNVFQVHGVNEHGKTVLRKQLRRDQVAPFFANLPACLVGIEACGSAHHWARKLQALGHTVRLMAPQFVKPYVKSNKNDAADAEAICEAVARPSGPDCAAWISQPSVLSTPFATPLSSLRLVSPPGPRQASTCLDSRARG
jgi:transposase